MIVTDLLAFRQAKEKAKKKASRNFRKLESRLHTAWREHVCCKCFDPISGGMSYVREVSITISLETGKEIVKVRKYHFPVCPGDDYRNEQRRREKEEARQANRKAA
ncbi:MAG: hypothetical protein WCT07_00360 [Candidatus Paceibacterota bacterium]|jgi:hypothetical protein